MKTINADFLIKTLKARELQQHSFLMSAHESDLQVLKITYEARCMEIRYIIQIIERLAGVKPNDK